MASDIWLRTIMILRKETRCRHIGYSFRLTARVLLYAPSHRQDSTYHGLCYTSRGALAGTRNSSMGSPHEGSIRRPIAPWANALTTELHPAPSSIGGIWLLLSVMVFPREGSLLYVRVFECRGYMCMYWCMYVCMCVCMSIYIFMYVCINVCVCMCLCVFFVNVYMSMCMVCVYTQTKFAAYFIMNISTNCELHTHIHTHMRTRTRVSVIRHGRVRIRLEYDVYDTLIAPVQGQARLDAQRGSETYSSWQTRQ